MRYLIQWNCGVGPTWEHEFDIATDDMAIDFIRRQINARQEMHGATRVYGWRLGESGEEGDASMILQGSVVVEAKLK